MRIAVQADDGDEVSISADVISAEQALVTLTIENALYEPNSELESLTLTVEKARELAMALMSVADAIEFVNTSADSLGMAKAGTCEWDAAVGRQSRFTQ
jgi:predicted secreted protein